MDFTQNTTECSIEIKDRKRGMKSLQPVVTVTLNPAVDASIAVDALKPGTLHRVAGLTQDPGGKGINVSKALQAFHLPTVATGFLGGERGEWIRSELSKCGVIHQFVTIDKETRLNVKVTDAAGQLTEFNTEASPISDADLEALGQIMNTLVAKDRWVALCGKLPPGCPPEWYQLMITECKKSGAKTVLDTVGEALRLGIEAKPDVIKPNLKELEQLVQKQLSTLQGVIDAARQIVLQGVGIVVVSCGEQGLVAVRSHEAIVVRVPKVNVLSTVGAGDTAVAGFLYGFCNQLPFEETIRFAAAAGTAAVQRAGTANPNLLDVRNILPHVSIERLGAHV